jgi:hypothetical protein
VTKYTIRDAIDRDLPGIVLLRHGITEFRSLGSDEYESFWKSLIRENPCSIHKILVAVNDQNEIVAHYAMVPFKFMKDGKILLGGFLCQLMVREDYRNELIFPKMELMFLKDYKDVGFDFAYSLGNRAHVVKAHLSFGFCKIGDLPVYARPCNIDSLVRKIIKRKVLRVIMRPLYYIAAKFLHLRRCSLSGNIAVQNTAEFDSGIDTFVATLNGFFSFIALRNAEVLNWRFRNGVSSDYLLYIAKEHHVIVGYMVLRRMKMKELDVLAIVDILFSPKRPDIGKALLSVVHELAVYMQVDVSACLLNPHGPLCKIFRKCGYLKTPESFSLFVHEPKGADRQFREDTFSKWHLTWFDNDAV